MYHDCLHPASNNSTPKQWLLPQNYFLPWLLGLYQLFTRHGSCLERDGKEEDLLTPGVQTALQKMSFLLHAGGLAERGCPAGGGTALWNSLSCQLIKVPIRQTLRTGPVRGTRLCCSRRLQSNPLACNSLCLSTHVLVFLGLLTVWIVPYVTYWADLAPTVTPFGDLCVPHIGPKAKTCISAAVPKELPPPGIYS